MSNKSETDKLNAWLLRNSIDAQLALEQLRSLRNSKDRKYGHFEQSFNGDSIRIGVVGDTHFGNKWTDKKFLNSVFREFKSQGVERVYHTGDMTDGPWQRHQNVLEQYAHGIDAQVKDFVRDYPNIGVQTFLIDGNHDGWYRKMGAGKVGELIAEKRKDVTYLGSDEALIKINDITLMLSHPDDGSSYAYSYKPQKFVESMFKMGERMPDVILQGHYHKLFQMHFGGVAYVCTGTTERQTPWMRGKKISADMGTYILDIHTRRKSGLVKLTSTLLPYSGNKHEQTIR